MKQTKSVSKTGWIPKGEKIGETWQCSEIDSDSLVFKTRKAVENANDFPRKVKVTLTLTVEDVK